jgi:hypothetical protein
VPETTGPQSRAGDLTTASAVGAASSSVAALLVTLCCAGPLAYTVLGAGGVLAAARLQPWRPWLLGAALVFLALGFWSAYRRTTRDAAGQVCRVRTSRGVRMTLWMAALLTVIVAIFG